MESCKSGLSEKIHNIALCDVIHFLSLQGSLRQDDHEDMVATWGEAGKLQHGKESLEGRSPTRNRWQDPTSTKDIRVFPMTATLGLSM